MQIARYKDLCDKALQLREADWAESTAVATAIAAGQPRLAQATEHLAGLQPHCAPPTAQQVGGQS